MCIRDRAHTHEAVMTGQIDSKFGFALETGEAMEAVKFATKFHHVRLKGMHNHIGSQIFDIEPFKSAAKVMLEFMNQIRIETVSYTHLDVYKRQH